MDCYPIFLGVLGFLGKGLIIVGAFHFGRFFSAYYKHKWRNYLLIAGMVGLLSLFAWSSYGTHIEDDDPIFGGGNTIDDFEPSDEERNTHALTVFLSLLLPACCGVYKGNDQ
jgi:hypothetical protein